MTKWQSICQNLRRRELVPGGMPVGAGGLLWSVRDLLLDLALPETDRGVAIQWLVMAPVWVLVALWSKRLTKDVRQFVLGLVLLNVAWFFARMVH